MLAKITSGAVVAAVTILVAGVNADAADLGPWTHQSDMLVGRVNHGAAASGSYVYAIGGANSSNEVLDSVEFAPVSADGTVGSWSLTTHLLTPRYVAAAVGVGTKLYAVGGWSGTGCCSGTIHHKSTEIGSVNADGTIASWTYGPDLVEGMGNGGLITDGMHLYYVGGFGDADKSTTVQVTDVNADGSLAPWRTTTPLPIRREAAAATIAAGRVYAFGGYEPAYLDSVVSAPILGNGDLGDWGNEQSLSVPRIDAVAFKGLTKIFVGGGISTGNQPVNSFEEAVLGADGVLGASMPSTAMNVARAGAGGAAVGNVLVVTGGTSNGTDRRRDTESSICLDCKSACPLTTTTTTLPAADADGDGVLDSSEACTCLGTAPREPVTRLGCAVGQLCRCAAPIGRSTWASHTEYVRCVKLTAHELESDGIVGRGQRRDIVRAAARSACGR